MKDFPVPSCILPVQSLAPVKSMEVNKGHKNLSYLLQQQAFKCFFSPGLPIEESWFCIHKRCRDYLLLTGVSFPAHRPAECA